MPMDENTKNELVKRIQEQRRAMWKGEPLSNQPRKQTQPNPEEIPSNPDVNVPAQPKPEDNVDTLKLSDLIPDDQKSTQETGPKKGLKDWLKLSDSDLSWKKAIIIVSLLVGAIIIGISLGYIVTLKL
ncbi:MAG: hypothetical protein AAB116_18350 [Candidatus Poribacteria bacterium]